MLTSSIMFWLSVFTTTLCYVAIFNIFERFGKGHKIPLAVPEQLWSISSIFTVINSFTIISGVMGTLFAILGAIPFSFIYEIQYWPLGYALYYILVGQLYPELELKNNKLACFWAIGVYIYSYGWYSWIYSLVILNGLETVFSGLDLSNLEPKISWIRFIKNGWAGTIINCILLLSGMVMLNVLPVVFFFVNMCLHDGILILFAASVE